MAFEREASVSTDHLVCTAYNAGSAGGLQQNSTLELTTLSVHFQSGSLGHQFSVATDARFRRCRCSAREAKHRVWTTKRGAHHAFLVGQRCRNAPSSFCRSRHSVGVFQFDAGARHGGHDNRPECLANRTRWQHHDHVNYTLNSTAPQPSCVSFQITRLAGATGTVTLSFADYSITGALGGCVLTGGTGDAAVGTFCGWFGAGQTASITASDTASGDAGGQWLVEPFQQLDPWSVVLTSAGATASIIVATPAAATTTTSRGVSPVAPTTAPSFPAMKLPRTGPRDTSAVVSLGVSFLAVTVGGLLIAMTRRRLDRA